MAKLDENLLSEEELEYYWELLLKKRAEILGDVSQMESSAIKKDVDEVASSGSSMPIHMADIGSDNYEQDFTIGLIGSERKLLDMVNAALRRIKMGTFGICLGTGNKISKKRLEAMPWAKYSIEYATQIEKGLADEVDEDDD
ncbi:MAG: TraR/DksA family transcriptional regulator [Sedimentisphaeraceae bacterium JB056]